MGTGPFFALAPKTNHESESLGDVREVSRDANAHPAQVARSAPAKAGSDAGEDGFHDVNVIGNS
jgi:hypothetical protein